VSGEGAAISGARSRAVIAAVLLGSAAVALAPAMISRTQRVHTMRTELRSVLAQCREQYAGARTAADTARADAWFPTTLGKRRPADPACVAYRKRDMLR
jgi:type II secretory pathway pseudopilin PulG